MAKIEMESLLTYENGKLMLEGYDLVELANMHHTSVADFLELVRVYLNLRQSKLKGGYSIVTSNTEIFTPKSTFKEYKSNGEILVNVEDYEDIKKGIFNLAYTNCSKHGDSNFQFWGLDNSSEQNLAYNLEKPYKTYTLIYRSFRTAKWNQKVSNIPIDVNDQEERYSQIKR